MDEDPGAIKRVYSWGITLLHVACFYGEKDALEILLSSGADVNAREMCGSTPLHMLVRSISLKLKGQSLGHNKMVSIDSKSYLEALHFKSLPAWDEYAQMIDSLISHGADINARDGGGNTPLFDAAENGPVELVEILIKRGADVNARNDDIKTFFFDPEGENPLHLAAKNGKKEVAELLVSNGADINSRDKFGRPPLYDAFWVGKRSIVDLLIKKGAELPKTTGEEIYDAILADDAGTVKKLLDKDPGLVNTKKHDRELMPLHLAAAMNREEIAGLLISKGADLNARDSLENWRARGWSALHWAADNDSIEVIRLLIKNGAEVDDFDKYNQTPLHLAAAEGHLRAAEILISAGAELSSVDAEGQAPLHMAALNNQSEMIVLLLSKGADKNVKCRQRGATPLSDAVLWNQHRAIDVLIENGASLVTGEDSDVYNSIMLGDVKKAKNIICNNPDMIDKAESDQGWTPLHCAAIAGNIEIARFLIDKGAKPDRKDFWELTPLFWAIRSGSCSLVELLLESGSDVYTKDSLGFTPLRWAELRHDDRISRVIKAYIGKEDIWSVAGKGDLIAVKAMLKKNPALINSKDADSRTPLHSAAAGDLKDMSALLIAQGADVNARDGSGDTPLHYAACNKSGVLVELLLRSGADVNAGNGSGETPLHKASSKVVCESLLFKGALVNIKDRDGYAPVHTISRKGTRAMAELLISRGAYLNASDNITGRNPLCIAASTGNVELVKFYVEKGVNVNIPEKQYPGQSPLYLAAEVEDEAISLDAVKFLVSKGANVNFIDSSCEPLISRQAEMGRYEAVDLLLSKGARVNVKPEDGQTSLYTALNFGYTKRFLDVYDPRSGEYSLNLYPRNLKNSDAYRKTIDILLAAGADVNLKNDRGMSPLHLASVLGWTEMASLLIKHGARVNDSDRILMYTPLHYAARRGNNAVIELLVSNGADVNAPDKNNKTPLKLALESRQMDAVKLLRAHGGRE